MRRESQAGSEAEREKRAKAKAEARVLRLRSLVHHIREARSGESMVEEVHEDIRSPEVFFKLCDKDKSGYWDVAELRRALVILKVCNRVL